MSRARLSPLCAAVKRLREASKLSQEVFAQNLGITVTSVSRFERGVTEPVSFSVLNALWSMAKRLGLPDEETLFDTARQAVRARAYQGPQEDASPSRPRLPQWRLATAAHLASLFRPECVPEAEKLFDRELAIVDAVLGSTVDLDYQRLEREVFQLAEQQAIQDLKRGNK